MSVVPAIRDAATVTLLRDGEDGLEVLLLRRHSGHVFAPNAHVFPGGAVDDDDAAAALDDRCINGADYAEVCLGDTGRARAFWLAAIRECFEEAGLLVGCEVGAAVATDHARERAALNAGQRSWMQVATHLDLRFRLDELAYFAYWLTPAGLPRRYATRFFAARAPAHQRPSADGHETTGEWWARPGAALAGYARGEVVLLPPTRATLERLCDYEDAESALAGLVEDGLIQP